MEKGVPVRSISRCLAMLKFINSRGPVSLMEIAKAVSLPYPTTIRIVQTLMFEGMIECEPVRKLYRATSLVQTLAVGAHEHGDLVQAGRPVLIALTREHGWPASICTASGPSMMVRDSTYTMTSLSFNNYYPGYTFPMLEVASGLAHLAFASDETRECLLMGLAEGNGDRATIAMFRSGALTRRIRGDGYATHDRTTCTLNPGKTSSIAVPIFEGDRVAGTLTLSYFATAMTMAEAVRRYALELQARARSARRWSRRSHRHRHRHPRCQRPAAPERWRSSAREFEISARARASSMTSAYFACRSKRLAS